MVLANLSYEELKSQAEPLLKELLVGGTITALNFTDMYFSCSKENGYETQQVVQIHVGPFFTILNRKPKRGSLHRLHAFRTKKDMIKRLCELQADVIVNLELLESGDLQIEFRSGKFFCLSGNGSGDQAWMINTEDQEYFIVCREGKLAIVQNLVR